MSQQENSLIVPVVSTTKPCEECKKTPALQWAIPGIGSGVLCRSCLNAVIEQINAALAAMAQEESERAGRGHVYKVGDTVHIKNTLYHATVSAIYPHDEGTEETSYALSMPRDAMKAGHKPFEFMSARLIEPAITCSQCGKPLLPATTFDYQGAIYCPDCLPKYDKHEQF